MPWGITRKQVDDKVEFEIPEDVQQKITAGEKASQELEQLKVNLASKDTEAAELKQRLETLEAAAQAARAAADAKAKPVAEEEEPDWFADPKAAVNTTLNKSLMPMAVAVAEMRSDRILDELRLQYPELKFPALAQEFDSVISKYSIGNRANREFMLNAFRVVRDKLREEGKLETQDYNNFMERSRQSSGMVSASNGDTSSKPKHVFSEDEKRFMQRYDISEADYTKTLEEGRFKTLA